MHRALERDIRLIAEETMKAFEVTGLAVARAIDDQPIEYFI